MPESEAGSTQPCFHPSTVTGRGSASSEPSSATSRACQAGVTDSGTTRTRSRADAGTANSRREASHATVPTARVGWSPPPSGATGPEVEAPPEEPPSPPEASPRPSGPTTTRPTASTVNASPGSTDTSCAPASSARGRLSHGSAITAAPRSRSRRDALIFVATTRSPRWIVGPSWQVSVTGSSLAAGRAPMRAPEGSCTHTSARPAGTGAPVGVRTSAVVSMRTVSRSVWSGGRSTSTEPSSCLSSFDRSTRVRCTPVSMVTTSGAAGAAERGAHRRRDPTSCRSGRRSSRVGEGPSGACQLVARSPSTAAFGPPAGSVTADSPKART